MRTRRIVLVGLACRTPVPATRGLAAPGGSMSPPTFGDRRAFSICREILPPALSNTLSHVTAASNRAAACARCALSRSMIMNTAGSLPESYSSQVRFLRAARKA